MLAHGQTTIEAAQLGVVAHRRLSRFHQQKAQKRTALFADVPQFLLAAAGVLAGNQSKVASHFLARRKPLRRPQRQHHGQRRHRPHSRMRLQLHRRRPFPHFLLHAGSVAGSPLPIHPALPATAGAVPRCRAATPTPPARLRSTACASSALPGSTPWPATGSSLASVPALACGGVPATAARPALPDSAPRCAETDPGVTAAAHVPRPAGPSSVCAPPRPGSRPHPQTTTRAPTPPATARTRDSVRRLPSPPAPTAPPASGKTVPLPRGAPAAVVVPPQFDCQRSRPAENSDENHSL